MLALHATPTANLDSIAARGLLLEFARGPRKAVWICWRRLALWAVCHTAKRHGVDCGDVLAWNVDVPCSWIKRHRSGLFYVERDIPADRLRDYKWLARD